MGLKKLGVLGLAGENQTVWGGSGLFYYIKARLLWDIKSDVDQLISEFCCDMFGPSALVMKKFYKTFEQKLQEFDDHLVYGRWVNNIDNQTLNVLSDYLIEALQKADTAWTKKRIKMVQVGVNNLIIGKMGANPATQENEELLNQYKQLCSATLQLIEEIDEPLPMAVTGQWFAKLKRNSE